MTAAPPKIITTHLIMTFSYDVRESSKNPFKEKYVFRRLCRVLNFQYMWSFTTGPRILLYIRVPSTNHTLSLRVLEYHLLCITITLANNSRLTTDSGFIFINRLCAEFMFIANNRVFLNFKSIAVQLLLYNPKFTFDFW